jgi:hypothetical protein
MSSYTTTTENARITQVREYLYSILVFTDAVSVFLIRPCMSLLVFLVVSLSFSLAHLMHGVWTVQSAYWLDSGLCNRETWVPFPVGPNDFSPLHSVQTNSGANSSSYQMGKWVPGVLSPRVSGWGHEADQSIPSSAAVLFLHFPICFL